MFFPFTLWRHEVCLGNKCELYSRRLELLEISDWQNWEAEKLGTLHANIPRQRDRKMQTEWVQMNTGSLRFSHRPLWILPSYWMWLVWSVVNVGTLHSEDHYLYLIVIIEAAGSTLVIFYLICYDNWGCEFLQDVGILVQSSVLMTDSKLL